MAIDHHQERTLLNTSNPYMRPPRSAGFTPRGYRNACHRAGIAAMLAAMAVLPMASQAQQGPPPSGERPAPPPEAIAACSGKSVGDTVSFTGRRGDTITGTCEQIGDVLAARPAGRPPKGSPPSQ